LKPLIHERHRLRVCMLGLREDPSSFEGTKNSAGVAASPAAETTWLAMVWKRFVLFVARVDCTVLFCYDEFGIFSDTSCRRLGT
jgi:hypothetical protein